MIAPAPSGLRRPSRAPSGLVSEQAREEEGELVISEGTIMVSGAGRLVRRNHAGRSSIGPWTCQSGASAERSAEANGSGGTSAEVTCRPMAFADRRRHPDVPQDTHIVLGLWSEPLTIRRPCIVSLQVHAVRSVPLDRVTRCSSPFGYDCSLEVGSRENADRASLVHRGRNAARPRGNKQATTNTGVERESRHREGRPS